MNIIREILLTAVDVADVPDHFADVFRWFNPSYITFKP